MSYDTDFGFTHFFPDLIASVVIIFFFPFAALNLTQRTSAAAFDTKIKIKIRQGEFAEALELVNEWQFIDPEVRENFDELFSLCCHLLINTFTSLIFVYGKMEYYGKKHYLKT